MKRPVVIKLNEDVTLIPTCTEEKDILQFVNVCDLANNSVD